MATRTQRTVIKIPFQEALDALNTQYSTNYSIKNLLAWMDDTENKTVQLDIDFNLVQGLNTITYYTFTYQDLITAIVDKYQRGLTPAQIASFSSDDDTTFLDVWLV